MNRSTAAYIVKSNKLLLLLRDNIPTIKDPNKWDTPGGGCEEGETYEECILREIKEELEFEFNKMDLIAIGSAITPRGNKEKLFLIYVDDDKANKFTLHEGQEMRFFSLDEILKLDLTAHLSSFFPKKKGELQKMLEGKIDSKFRLM